MAVTNAVTIPLSLDVSTNPIRSISLKQYSQGYTLVVTITNDGNPVSIDRNTESAYLKIKTSSGNDCLYSGTINSNGTVSFALTNQVTYTAGQGKGNVDIYNASNEKRVPTLVFNINIEASSYTDADIYNSDDFKLFYDYIDDADALRTELNGIANTAQTKLNEVNQKMITFGSPLVASTSSAMTDKNRVYVYTGSQSGYVNGNWYYWNGSAWTSGGPYNASAAATDKTLTVTDMAADAKVTGDEITALKEDLTELEKTDVKQKLLNDNIPDTTQSYTFAGGSVSKVEHKSGNTVIRTDAFTYTDSVITETRTLNTGDKLVIATNLSTLETTVTYTAA